MTEETRRIIEQEETHLHRPQGWETPARLRERADAAHVVCQDALSRSWKPLASPYWDDCVIAVQFKVGG